MWIRRTCPVAVELGSLQNQVTVTQGNSSCRKESDLTLAETATWLESCGTRMTNVQLNSALTQRLWGGEYDELHLIKQVWGQNWSGNWFAFVEARHCVSSRKNLKCSHWNHRYVNSAIYVKLEISSWLFSLTAHRGNLWAWGTTGLKSNRESWSK